MFTTFAKYASLDVPPPLHLARERGVPAGPVHPRACVIDPSVPDLGKYSTDAKNGATQGQARGVRIIE